MSVTPDRETFLALAADHTVVPIHRELLADLDTPLSVYARLRGDGPTFLLESAEHGRNWGRYSFIGTDPLMTLRGRGGEVVIEAEPGIAVPDAARDADGPLAALDALVGALHAPDFPSLPLHGGAVGVIGYDAVREVEDIPDTGTDDLGLPDVLMMVHRHVVGLDHLRQTMTVVTNVVVGDDPATQYDEAVTATDALVERLATSVASSPKPPPVLGEAAPSTSNLAAGEYEAMVERVKEHIVEGDTFQTVVSQRLSASMEADPFDLYRVLRVINPSPYLFYFDFEDFQVVGSSPEALVQVKGRHVETWPIAGTRPRGATEAQDRELERELLGDAKERAEHVMLVDLGRNDLGRVCEIGSVEVDEMMVVERYSHVMHLVSSVTGTLRDGLSPVDVLRSVFPAGTVSGAPKVRAMQIIDDLEPSRRGVYAGAVGYVDFSGNLDTCIALRTAVVKDGVVHVQAGAGIVADSDPTTEQQESRDKAGALLSAVAAAEAWRDPVGGGAGT
ncbi:anthranilate synthase component I [Salsipaludibacter albus]|uniref:anthranilate synthase component I n=1 Tax=Salsipaludibacter albus TaxID=2849650 RepID=UPI001EE43FAE|nr:anthranilate synthase component I [Salsipaludibacter albus]MBY5163179.1 anthranilate synthase component I [Salsipaludibacter albus]